MGKRTTFAGYIRARGATSSSSSSLSGPTPGVVPITLAVPVDAAAADGSSTGYYVPAGAVINDIAIVSGHTGGTAPLLNIGLDDGTTPDVDGLLDGVVADANVNAHVAAVTPATGALGVSFGVALTVDSEITAGKGGGTPGTGASIAYITYVMTDDGSIQN